MYGRSHQAYSPDDDPEISVLHDSRRRSPPRGPLQPPRGGRSPSPPRMSRQDEFLQSRSGYTRASPPRGQMGKPPSPPRVSTYGRPPPQRRLSPSPPMTRPSLRSPPRGSRPMSPHGRGRVISDSPPRRYPLDPPMDTGRGGPRKASPRGWEDSPSPVLRASRAEPSPPYRQPPTRQGRYSSPDLAPPKVARRFSPSPPDFQRTSQANKSPPRKAFPEPPRISGPRPGEPKQRSPPPRVEIKLLDSPPRINLYGGRSKSPISRRLSPNASRMIAEKEYLHLKSEQMKRSGEPIRSGSPEVGRLARIKRGSPSPDSSPMKMMSSSSQSIEQRRPMISRESQGLRGPSPPHQAWVRKEIPRQDRYRSPSPPRQKKGSPPPHISRQGSIQQRYPIHSPSPTSLHGVRPIQQRYPNRSPSPSSVPGVRPIQQRYPNRSPSPTSEQGVRPIQQRYPNRSPSPPSKSGVRPIQQRYPNRSPSPPSVPGLQPIQQRYPNRSPSPPSVPGVRPIKKYSNRSPSPPSKPGVQPIQQRYPNRSPSPSSVPGVRPIQKRYPNRSPSPPSKPGVWPIQQRYPNRSPSPPSVPGVRPIQERYPNRSPSPHSVPGVRTIQKHFPNQSLSPRRERLSSPSPRPNSPFNLRGSRIEYESQVGYDARREPPNRMESKNVPRLQARSPSPRAGPSRFPPSGRQFDHRSRSRSPKVMRSGRPNSPQQFEKRHQSPLQRRPRSKSPFEQIRGTAPIRHTSEHNVSRSPVRGQPDPRHVQPQFRDRSRSPYGVRPGHSGSPIRKIDAGYNRPNVLPPQRPRSRSPQLSELKRGQPVGPRRGNRSPSPISSSSMSPDRGRMKDFASGSMRINREANLGRAPEPQKFLSQKRSVSPARRTDSPIHRLPPSDNRRRSPSDNRRRSPSDNRRRSPSDNRRKSPSPRKASPVRRLPSHHRSRSRSPAKGFQKRSQTPPGKRRGTTSPIRRPIEQRRSRSPSGYGRSPDRRKDARRGNSRPTSPKNLKRTSAPRMRSPSPRRRPISPRRSVSPRRRSLSPRRRSVSPRRRSGSPPAKRYAENSGVEENFEPRRVCNLFIRGICFRKVCHFLHPEHLDPKNLDKATKPRSPTPERHSASKPREKSSPVEVKTKVPEKILLQPLPKPLPVGPLADYPFASHDPSMILIGTVKEYINSLTGVLEVCEIGKRSLAQSANVYFHISFVYLQNKKGNPYGPPVKYVDMLCEGVSLKKEMPIGTKVYLTAQPIQVRCFELAALTVWPMATEQPPPPDTAMYTKLLSCLDEFRRNHSLVQATVPVFPWKGDPNSQAVVWQVKDDQCGIIELSGGLPNNKYRFFALFHKEQVWLKDGQRGCEVDFFKNQPLSAMVQVGQQVTLSARSVVESNGFFLKPSVLELQAIIVSVNPDGLPNTAPKPTRLELGTGAFMVSESPSWFYLQQDLKLTLNKWLLTYLTTYKKVYPKLSPDCLTLDPVLAKSGQVPTSIEPSNSFAPIPTEPKMVDSTGFDLAKLKPGELPVFLKQAEGQVVNYPNPDCLIIRSTNLELSWTCIVPTKSIYSSKPISGSFESNYPINSMLHVNATLLNDKKPVQYMATLAWSIHKVVLSQEESELRDSPLTKDSLKLYRAFSHRSVPFLLLKSKEGNVIQLLDDNYGVVKFGSDLVLFDSCDVWISPTTTLDKINKPLGDFLKVGTEVYFHGALINQLLPIPYIATALWLKTSDKVFENTLKVQSPLNRELIAKAKIDNYMCAIHAINMPALKSSITTDDESSFETFNYQCNAVIKRILENESGLIVELTDKPWKCIVPTSKIETYAKNNYSLSNSFPEGTHLRLGIALVNPSNEIQYIATMAWKKEEELLLKGGPLTQKSEYLDMHLDKASMELYHKNASRSNYLKASLPFRKKLIQRYLKAEGKVIKIIDDNFGIIESTKFQHQILFDACDIWVLRRTQSLRHSGDKLVRWITVGMTPSQIGQALSDIVQVGSVVSFNAVLIESAALVPYLATDVWTAETSKLLISQKQRQPMPASKPLRDQKIANYKVMVDLEHVEANLAPIFKKEEPVLEQNNTSFLHSMDPLPTSTIIQQPPQTVYPLAQAYPPMVPIPTNLTPMQPGTISYPPFRPQYPIPGGPYMQQQPLPYVTPRPPYFNLPPPIVPAPTQYPSSYVGSQNLKPLQSAATSSVTISKPPILNKEAMTAQAQKSTTTEKPLISFVSESNKKTEEVKPEDFNKSLTIGQTGVVKRIFRDSSVKTGDATVGGLVLLNGSEKVCFFMSKFSSHPFGVGKSVKLNTVPVEIPSPPIRVQVKVEYVAMTIYREGTDLDEPEHVRTQKYSTLSKKIIEISKLDTSALSPLNGQNLIVDINTIVMAPKVEGTPEAGGHLGKVIHTGLRSIITQSSGILECRREGESETILCYFEITDLNIQGPMKVKDLVRILSLKGGAVNISYILKHVQDDVIKYIAENIKVTGTLDPSLSHLRIGPLKNYKPLTDWRLKRFQQQVAQFKEGKVIPIDNLETPAAAAAPSRDVSRLRSDDIILGSGKIEWILDDNFGIIFGPSNLPMAERTFCLFDVCDLYLTNDQTAADEGKKVGEVTPVGTEVDYNACFIDGSKCIPYLATSLWQSKNKLIDPPLPSLPKDSIQSDKLDIYSTVANSSKVVVDKLRGRIQGESKEKVKRKPITFSPERNRKGKDFEQEAMGLGIGNS